MKMFVEKTKTSQGTSSSCLWDGQIISCHWASSSKMEGIVEIELFLIVIFICSKM